MKQCDKKPGEKSKYAFKIPRTIVMKMFYQVFASHIVIVIFGTG